MSDSSRRSGVTVTLGRSGRVVKRAGGVPNDGIRNGASVAGNKRSIRDRLGGISEDRSESYNKRQRSQSPSNSIDMCLSEDDLRFKLMQKNMGRDSRGKSMRNIDLRDKLSSKTSGPSAASLTIRPPESAASTRHPALDPRLLGMTRQPVLESRDTSILGRFPPSRNPGDLSAMAPPRSYTSWTLENLRRRSPDPVRRRSPDTVRRRSPDTVRRRSPDTVRLRSPDAVRRRSPNIVRRRSPDTVRRISPDTLRRRSPEDFRGRSPERVFRSGRSPERVFRSSAVRALSPERNREVLQRRPLMRPYDDGRSTSYMRMSPTRGVRSSPYLAQSSVSATPVKSVGPVPQHFPQPSGILQKIPPTIDDYPSTVDGLLQSMGLEKYAIYFKAEEVDMNALRQLGDGDLKALGIPMGPRKKILQAVMPRARRQP